MTLALDEPKTAAFGAREANPITLSRPQAVELNRFLQHAEYYQPLYGIDLPSKPLRPCRDRAQTIAAALAPMGSRPRMVDFGCSLGYFVFYFADRGAIAEGVDCLSQNIAAAQAIGRINGLSARWNCASLSIEYARSIAPGRYDAALILSVLHHIVHRQGLEYAQKLLAELTMRIPTLVLELAHRDEPVDFPWRASQPSDPLEILAACKNLEVQKLADFESHLSGARRPMWKVSRM